MSDANNPELKVGDKVTWEEARQIVKAEEE
jgi:ribosomal protein S17